MVIQPAIRALLLASAVFGTALAARARNPDEVPAEAIDRYGLPPADLRILDDPRYNWRHLQTDHFAIHYNQKMFAARVARMGEQFYEAISSDLPALQDQMSPRRSHIFIFHDPRDWQTVLSATPGLETWAVSFVRGPSMFLQEFGKGTSDKMDLLAHEMTHLVFNRFLSVQLPLWLNEGLAEYYGEFAYRRVRGMGQSRSNAFPPLREFTPMPDLLSARAYPADPADVQTFYATTKYLAGYLLWKLPRDKWDAFFARVLAGENASTALLDAYGWSDPAALEKDFIRFAR